MIRPWYRSRLFWFSIPWMLFLLWAWGKSNWVHFEYDLGDSEVHSTQGKLMWLELHQGYLEKLNVNYRTAEVSFEVLEPPKPLIGPVVRKSIVCGSRSPWWSTEVLAGERSWFSLPKWKAEAFNERTRYWLVSLPYWLLNAGHVGAWLVAVGWWQRRKVRLKASAAGSASSLAALAPERPASSSS